jgi:hypothetical protein
MMCFSARKVSPESKNIDKELKKAGKEYQSIHKILLLGAGMLCVQATSEDSFWRAMDFASVFADADLPLGDTGKTTFAKQMVMKYAGSTFFEKYIDITR